MRIVYLHQYFIDRDSAGGTRSYELARRMVEAGHDVHVVTLLQHATNVDAKWIHRVVDGIHIHSTPIPYNNKMAYPRRILAFLQFAVRAASKALRLNGDILYATSTPLTIAIPGLVASKLGRCPMIFEVRDLWPTIPIALGVIRNSLVIRASRWLERLAYFGSEHVIALSPGMADGVAATGYPRDSISVVPNACDVDLFGSPRERVPWEEEIVEWQGKRELIVYCGTLGYVNDVPWLVDVAIEAHRANLPVCFLVVGDGAELEKLAERARQTEVLGVNLLIKPPVPKSQVPALLARATAAISLVRNVPELQHNSANKFFDALAAGKPIIINHAGWQQELLSASGAGISVPYSDPEKAAHQISAFVSNPLQLSAASSAARTLAMGHFNRDRLAAQVIELVERFGRKRQQLDSSLL